MTNDDSQKIGKKLKSYVFKFECSQNWDDLTTTDDEKIRHCGECSNFVFSVQTDDELLANARKGRCVYLPPMRTAGIPWMPDEIEK